MLQVLKMHNVIIYIKTMVKQFLNALLLYNISTTYNLCMFS